MRDQRGRVLVVDDDADSRALLRRALERLGLAIDEAADGAQALARVSTSFYDAVLLDISMPGLDGFAVCARIRDHADSIVSRVPVVLVSARAEEVDRVAGFEAGADDYISKPWSEARIAARVTAAIAKSHLIRPEAYAPLLAEPEDTRDGAAPGRRVRGDPILTEIDRALARRASEVASHGGANILVLGPPRTGKSRAACAFAAEGLGAHEPCLFASFADDSSGIRERVTASLHGAIPIEALDPLLHVVDGARWMRAFRRNRLRGLFDDLDLALWNLLDLVTKGSEEIGQSLTSRAGGRRIFDALETLIEAVGPERLTTFVARIAGTASAFGGVRSLFILNPDGLPAAELTKLEGSVDAVIDVRAFGGAPVADLAQRNARGAR